MPARPARWLAPDDFACTGWPDQQDVLALRDEASGRQLEEEGTIHFLVEAEVEAVERSRRIAEACLDTPPVEQTILPALQFVVDEGREQIQRGEPFGLRMPQARFEDVGHPGEAERAECAIEFEEGHAVTPVRRSMSSR